MKTLLLWLIVIALGAAVVLYFNPGLVDRLRGLVPGQDSATTVYKWRDEQGVWHVTDEPPPPGTEYETQEYLPDTNVLPAPSTDPQR